MKLSKNIVFTVVSLVFLGSTMYFFGAYYHGHIHYNEQYQLFQITSEYFFRTVMYVGGMANYIGRFFTSFYLYSWVGAGIMSFFLTLIGILMYLLIRKNGSSLTLGLSYVPSIVLVAFFCDECAMLSTAVAFTVALATAFFVVRIEKDVVRLVALFLSIPIMYFLFGGLIFTGIAIILLSEFSRRKVFEASIISLVSVLIVIICIVLARYICWYPFSRLFFGTDYYRYYKVLPRIIWGAAVLAILIYALRKVLVDVKGKMIVEVSLTVVVFVCGTLFVKSRAQMEKEMVMRYDYCARMQKWGEIIKMARETTPTNEISIGALNLALMKTNQLPERMFNFLQIGTDGLIPQFHRDMTSSLIGSEIFFHLGLINTSQRMAFESQEAILDFQKSGRVQLRLAETAIINGNYDMARKYLVALQKTLFYRRVADKLLKLLGDEKAINLHPVYGTLRKYRLDEDFVFSRINMVSMLGRLVLKDHSNRGAAEYALCWCLLEKNLQRFVQLFSLARNAGYQRMPTHFQEAYAMAWLNHNGSLQNIPFPINDQIQQRLMNFARDMSQTKSMKSVANQYINTYWFYYQTKKL